MLPGLGCNIDRNLLSKRDVLLAPNWQFASEMARGKKNLQVCQEPGALGETLLVTATPSDGRTTRKLSGIDRGMLTYAKVKNWSWFLEWAEGRIHTHHGLEVIEMFKKLALVGLIGTAGTLGLVGTGAWSYVRTGFNSASDSVRENVPIEWEIKRARQMIADLQPEIARNLHVVAREEVGVKNLAEQIANKEAVLEKSKGEILRLSEDLKSGGVHFVYAGRSYSDDQVREDLANRFKQFKVHEQTTSKLAQVLAAREKNLDAARRKLDEMLSAKRELEIEVENLQARLTMVEVAHASSPVALDDSRLSSTRELLDEIRTRIDVSEQLVANEGVMTGTIQLDETTSPELLSEIADYFGEGRAEIESLVQVD